jgi:hypothetical protein
MNALQLAEAVPKLLSESSSDDQIQGKLFELVGEEGFDFMFAIMQDAAKFKHVTGEQLQVASGGGLPSTSTSTSAPTSTANAAIDFQDEYDQEYPPTNMAMMSLESLSLNQRRKREKKEKERAAMEAESITQLSNDPSMSWLLKAGFTEEYLEQQRSLGLHGGAAHNIQSNLEKWTENLAAPGTLEYHEKRGLPAGAKRVVNAEKGYEEVTIPAAKRLPKPEPDELVNVGELEKWAQLAFQGTKRLNRIQSMVFDTAYNSAENMLVCAPTGAGE